MHIRTSLSSPACPEIQSDDQGSQCRPVAEMINFNIQNEALVTIRVVNKNGIVVYDSAFPGREGVNLSDTEFFKKARLLPKK